MISRPLHNLWSSTLSLNAMPSESSYAGRQQQTCRVPFRRSKSVRDLNVYDAGEEESTASGRHLRRIVLRRSSDLGTGLGFSIRGGRELGIGIFVSKVVERSVADRAGLTPGDEILSVNDTSFDDVSHEEAIKILKSAPRLSMLVCSSGRVPGSCVVHQTYTWLDSEGRSVSPPPEYDHSFYSSPAHRKAVSRLHHTPRIQKVTMRIDKGQSLGLMIRGGVEYGLGIYITGVDKNSVADMASLKVGDQILEVNNQSFLDITHDEAVRVLKYSPVMLMTIREVGKVPYSCTTYDENSSWMYDRDLATTTRSPRSPRLLRKGYLASGIDDNLVHTIDMQALRILNEKAKLVLTKPELATLNYYRIEYERGQMTIDSFVAVLLEMFETEEKYALLQDIREVIHPLDLHKFDELIYKKDLEMARTRQRLGRDDRSSRNRFSSVSMDHLTSHVTTSSPRSTRRDLSRYETVHDPNVISEAAQNLAHHGLQQSRDSPRHQMNRVGRRHHGLLSSYHSSMVGGEYGQEYLDDDIRTPSEDSGVDSTNGSYYTTNRGNAAMMREPSGGRSSVDRWPSTAGRGYERLQHRPADEQLQMLRGRAIPRRHSGDEDLNYAEIQAQQQQRHQQTRSTDRRWSIGSEQSEMPAHYMEAADLNNTQTALIPVAPNYKLVTNRRWYQCGSVLTVLVEKTKPSLGLAIEGGSDTRHPLPRIINIQANGAAFEAGGLRVGHIILSVDGHGLEGLDHRAAANLIASEYAKPTSNWLKVVVTEKKQSPREVRQKSMAFLYDD